VRTPKPQAICRFPPCLAPARDAQTGSKAGRGGQGEQNGNNSLDRAAYPARDSTRPTCTADHVPPRAVGMLRLFKCRATSKSVMQPVPRASSIQCGSGGRSDRPWRCGWPGPWRPPPGWRGWPGGDLIDVITIQFQDGYVATLERRSPTKVWSERTAPDEEPPESQPWWPKSGCRVG
jgi:hypothetical protein